MDPFEFLDHVSATAKHDNPVPKNLLGYIDYDYDVSRFPQELPRVIFDGQGLSHKGYSCLGDYYPEPGDRVVLLPVGTDYVILGSLNNRLKLYPGQVVFWSSNHTQSQRYNQSATIITWDTDNVDVYDPFGFLVGGGDDSTISLLAGPESMFKVRGRIQTAGGQSSNSRAIVDVLLNGSTSRGGRYTSEASTSLAKEVFFESQLIPGGFDVSIQVSASTGPTGNPAYPTGPEACWVEVVYVGPGVRSFNE